MDKFVGLFVFLYVGGGGGGEGGGGGRVGSADSGGWPPQLVHQHPDP